MVVEEVAPQEAVGARPAKRGIRAPSLYAVAAFAVLTAIFLFGSAPRFDPDFWWHLKDGQYISLHHAVPSRDFMSYVFAGHTWTDHEWLAEVVMYGLYKLAGVQGPVIFFGLVIAATSALVYANMVLRRINRGVALVILLLGAIASTGSWGPRIQMLTLLFLSAYALILLRFEQTRDRRLLAGLPIIMLLWANSHGGFVLGIGFLALTLAGEALNRRFGREGAYSRADLQALAITLIVTIGVTLINPNGIRQLLYPFTFLVPNAFTNLIEESASPNFHLYMMVVFEGMLLLLIAAFYAGRRSWNWTHLLLVLAFTHLAFSESRNVPVWMVALSPLVALYSQEMFGWTYREKNLSGGVKSVINVAFMLLIVVAGVRGVSYLVSAKDVHTFENKSFPVKAVAYMRTHQLPSHVFVDYTWGGYMLWNLYPRYQDYMDSRADTLFTSRILDGYQAMYWAHPDWKATLARYDVTDVLVDPKAPLAQVLTQDSSWRRVFADSKADVFVRS